MAFTVLFQATLIRLLFDYNLYNTSIQPLYNMYRVRAISNNSCASQYILALYTFEPFVCPLPLDKSVMS